MWKYVKLLIFLLLVAMTHSSHAQLVKIKNGATVKLMNDAKLDVRGGFDLESGATLSKNGSSIINVTGNLNLSGTYTYSTGTFWLSGGDAQTINGDSEIEFYNLNLDKTANNVSLNQSIRVENHLRLITNTLLMIDVNDVTIGENGAIYPDSNTTGDDPLIDPFNDDKHISNNGKVDGGTLIREFGNLGTISSEKYVRFPVGTPDDTTSPADYYYTPARFTMHNGDVTFNSGSEISVKPIAAEHPDLEVQNVALKKYWMVNSSNIEFVEEGYSVRFEYNDAEVQGNEEQYLYCLFYRSGVFYINPGTGYGVEPINDRFRVDEVNEEEVSGLLNISGNWSAGQPEAVSNRYYSIANGDWDDPNSWSKTGYGGAAATSYPTTPEDLVFIGDGYEIDVTSTTDHVKSVRVQDEGRLNIQNNYYIDGDSLVVEEGATLAIASPDGITSIASSGSVQTDYRSFDQDAIYIYNGTDNQATGDGLPIVVQGLVVDNTGAVNNTVTLSNTIAIRDSLVINNGVLDFDTYTANGENADTTSREIIMRGGEIIVQQFPTNYKDAVFTAGKVTFDGTGSFTLPSSVPAAPGLPAVDQYNDITIQGSRGANTFITLSSTGEIRIGGNFSISGLTWNPTPNAERFLVTGSTVVFNGSSAQSIPSGFAVPVDETYRLTYYNLIIRGSGNKQLTTVNNRFFIRNNLTLESATLDANNFDIWLLGDWTTSSGDFTPGTGKVTFEANGATNQVVSNSIVEFNDVDIDGTATGGILEFTDDLTINGDLVIDPATLKSSGGSDLYINGDMTINGTYTAGTGSVIFGSNSDQALDHSGTGNFYDIDVNKSTGDVVLDGTTNITIDNQLTLTQGNINGRTNDRPIIMDGTISRPAGTPGHIDGKLRLPFTIDDNAATTFDIGYGDDYAPMELDINGYGGAAGYLEALVQLDLDPANMTRDIIETDTPDGAALDSTKNIRKSWMISANFTGGSFQLGAARTYDLTLNYPASDVRNGGDPLFFELRQRNGETNPNNWIRTTTDSRTATSIKIADNPNLSNTANQYYFTGEPLIFTFYSIADGNWNTASTWSTAGYGSTDISTRAPASYDNVNIGDGKTVTLDANHTVDADREIIVEVAGASNSAGVLSFGTNYIDGDGTFTIDEGGIVELGHANGITASSNDGNVRTSTRNYNGASSHNSSNFIYNAPSGDQSAGDGLPDHVSTLEVDISASNTLTVSSAFKKIRVEDSLYVNTGELDASDAVIMMAGNFRIGTNGTFENGSNRVPTGTNGTNFARDSTYTGGFIFVGDAEQYVIDETSANTIYLNRVGIDKQNGEVIALNNMRTAQLFFHTSNTQNINVRDANKYFMVYPEGGGTYWLYRNSFGDSQWGYIDGRLVRYMDDGDEILRVWPIGTESYYSPLTVDFYYAWWWGWSGFDDGDPGLIEIVAAEGNHPRYDPFSSPPFSPNTNIEMFWEITVPDGLTPAHRFGDRYLYTTIYFSDNEPRGGVDPLDYEGWRLQSDTDNDWTNSTYISTNDNASNYIEVLLNNQTLGDNGLYSATSEFSASSSITLMVGVPTSSITERIFYSIANGDWTDPNTWAYSTVAYEDTEQGYDLTTNSVNDYPRFNNGTTRDYAYIGDNRTVTLDDTNFDIAFAQVEESDGGVGTLSMPGENYFQTEQFVLKDGGRLEIGSSNGIRDNSTSAGNIRQENSGDIINYNWNNLNNNRFTYIGSSDQVTGNGLPDEIAELTINNTGTGNDDDVVLTNSVTISGDLTISDGSLQYSNSETVSLEGDFINNADANALRATSASSANFTFSGSADQTISGTSTQTTFPSPVYVDITGSDLLVTDHDIYLDYDMELTSESIVDIEDNITFTLSPDADITKQGGDDFGTSRMLLVSGGANTAKLRKEFNTGTGSTNSAFFPVGENSNISGVSPIYNEATIDLNSMDFASNNYLELELRAQYPHYDAGTTPNMFRKYWALDVQNITRSSGNVDLQLMYNDAEIVGNILNYLPMAYRRTTGAEGWSFILDNPTIANIDTTNKYIIVEGANRLPDQDWSGGAPESFAKGSVYWSIASGDWHNPSTWTNDSNNEHTSTITANNIPGYFADDTVYISNSHIVDLTDSPNHEIDSLAVGATGTGGGNLRFNTSNGSHKVVVIDLGVNVASTGVISKQNATGPSVDTLKINNNLTNTSTGAGNGLDLFINSNEQVAISFIGSENSFIDGEGNYEDFGIFELNKDSQADTVFNTSSNFSTAVDGSAGLEAELNSGVYYHDINSTITLSTDGQGDKIIGTESGLIIDQGTVNFDDGLIAEISSFVYLNGGALNVGNAADEHFQYEETPIELYNSSSMTVAGSFRRRFLTSSTDFLITDDATLTAVDEGSTTESTDRRGGFDIGESNSSFTMTGGTIIVRRPMDENVSGEKDPDYYIGASTYNVTSGLVQLGEYSLAITGEPFSIITTAPLWDLDIQNTYGETLTLGSAQTTIYDDLFISDNSSFSLNGQIIDIGGDLTIEGTFLNGTSGTRRVIFNGNSTATPATSDDQVLKIETNTSDPFYEIAISKPNGGNLILSDDAAYPFSNLLIDNTLEFSTDNEGLILCDSTLGNRYVQVGSASNTGSIQRFGNGHVAGELRRWAESGIASLVFHVGTDNAEYTPATIDLSSGAGTAGYLSVISYGQDHPDLASNGFTSSSTNIQRYWSINTIGATALGTRTYDLTTQFMPGPVSSGGDIQAGATYGVFEHFRYSPSYPAAGTWFERTSTTMIPASRTTSLVKTTAHNSFSDFIIGEPSGRTFYSIADGYWNQPSSWSTIGYGGAPETTIYPELSTDQVRIGDGKTITIRYTSPNIRSVTIETAGASSEPGTLSFQDDRYLRGISFDLNDDCTVETDDAFGFTSLTGPTPNIGSVRTNTVRNFGEGRYVYSGAQNQATGDGIPSTIDALIVDNNGTYARTVTTTNSSVLVNDTVYVKRGILSLSSSEIDIQGNFVIDNRGLLSSGTSTFKLSGTNDQYIVLNNNGIALYKMTMDKASGTVTLTGSNSSANVSVSNELEFASSNTGIVDTRTNDRKLTMLLGSSVTRTTPAEGHIDGLFELYLGNGNETALFPLGFGTVYTPVTLTFSGGPSGTSGAIQGISYSPIPYPGNRVDPANKVDYYWSVTSPGTFSLGSRSFNTLFEFPSSELSGLSMSGGVPDQTYILRKSIPAETPTWQSKDPVDLSWDTGLASVELNGGATKWTGFGEFYIGQKGNIAFYSLNDGDWTDHNSWTYNSDHTGPSVEDGEYPNPEPSLNKDTVEIALDHEITLDKSSVEIAEVRIHDTSKLDLQTNTLTGISGSILHLGEPTDDVSGKDPILSFGGTSTPATNATGFDTYFFGEFATVEYTGTQTVTPLPFGMAQYNGNVQISGSGTKLINDTILIIGDFRVTSGAAVQINGPNLLEVRKNVINSGTITNNSVIEIGE